MLLSQRPVRPDELSACFPSLGEPFVFAQAVRSQVPLILRRWCEEGRTIGHVIEDHAELCRPRVVGLSLVVFLTDEAAAWLRDGQMPFVRNELIRRELAGDSQVLTASAIRSAQRGDGLNMLYFNHALTHRGFSEEDLHRVHTCWADTFLDLRGLVLKQILCEIHQETVCTWGLSCGMEPRHLWRGVSVEAGAPSTDIYQIGTTREEAAKRIGASTADLFLVTRPRFGFTIRQQELLKEALMGATDGALAARLNLSLAAIKKRWVTIYEQVSERAPGWLEEKLPTPPPGEGRGAEKRRRLLLYLRQHPEELHPANARVE